MASVASVTPTTPRPPGPIGRFDPLRVLGRGGQAVVYLAHDPKLDRQTALKILRRDHRNPEPLINEARNVARPDHPGIVSLWVIDIAGTTTVRSA